MKTKYYTTQGMPLLRMPATKKDKTNAARRGIVDMGWVTAAQMISETGLRPDGPTIFCGQHQKLCPLIRRFTMMLPLPYVLVGTSRDLDDSPLMALDHDWDLLSLQKDLPAGNGVIKLTPGVETLLSLQEMLPQWHGHVPILCLGNGIQVDGDALALLNGLGTYVIVTTALERSVRGNDVAPTSLLRSMDHVVVSSMGAGAKDLLSILPDFQYERVTNTNDLNVHGMRPRMMNARRRDVGVRLSQSRTLETRCILTQEELTAMHDEDIMLIYDACSAHTWIGKIVR